MEIRIGLGLLCPFKEHFFKISLQVAELIQMIKRTKIPIICICNDRQSTKVRSLANHCFDLRFHRPRAEQIKVSHFDRF